MRFFVASEFILTYVKQSSFLRLLGESKMRAPHRLIKIKHTSERKNGDAAKNFHIEV